MFNIGGKLSSCSIGFLLIMYDINTRKERIIFAIIQCKHIVIYCCLKRVYVKTGQFIIRNKI